MHYRLQFVPRCLAMISDVQRDSIRDVGPRDASAFFAMRLGLITLLMAWCLAHRVLAFFCWHPSDNLTDKRIDAAGREPKTSYASIPHTCLTLGSCRDMKTRLYLYPHSSFLLSCSSHGEFISAKAILRLSPRYPKVHWRRCKPRPKKKNP